MYKAVVLAHFNDSQTAVANAIGLTKSAVNQWPDVVPLKSAIKLQAATRGALALDMAVYELPALPSRPASRRAAV
jgi:DNA-binding transcriptional regulator YdaS (Cro superfamily)